MDPSPSLTPSQMTSPMVDGSVSNDTDAASGNSQREFSLSLPEPEETVEPAESAAPAEPQPSLGVLAPLLEMGFSTTDVLRAAGSLRAGRRADETGIGTVLDILLERRDMDNQRRQPLLNYSSSSSLASGALSSSGDEDWQVGPAYLGEPTRWPGRRRANGPRRPRRPPTHIANTDRSRPSTAGPCGDCPICLEVIARPSTLYQAPGRACEHTFHRECFTEHLATRVRDGAVLGIVCPLCPREISAAEVQNVLSPELADRYARLVRDRGIAEDAGRRHCPHPGCDGVLERPMAEKAAVTCGVLTLAALMLAFGIAAGLAGARTWGYVASPLPSSILPSPSANALVAVATGAASLLGLALATTRPGPRRVRAKWGISSRCETCGEKMCFACGAPSHPGRACQDIRDTTVETWAQSRDAGRCPKCGTMIERTAGCNHMTCRRASGGCGYQFCWLCREEYSSGHFGGPPGGGRCPQYGGSPARDIFEGSHLVWLQAPAILAAGVLCADLMTGPRIGPLPMLWGSATFGAGFVALRASQHRRLAARPILAALVAPVLGIAACGAWAAVRWALSGLRGDYVAAALAVLILEVTGLMAEPPATARANLGSRVRRCASKRLGALALALGLVFLCVGVVYLADWLDNTKTCSKVEGFKCVLLWSARLLAQFVIVALVILAIAVGGSILRPGLADVATPTSWWICAAGLARAVALTALLITFPRTLSGFYHTVGSVLLFAAGVCAVVAGLQCVVGLASGRRLAWPLPWLAFAAVWSLRLYLELCATVDPSLQGLASPSFLAAATQIWAGMLAGAALATRCRRAPAEGAAGTRGANPEARRPARQARGAGAARAQNLPRRRCEGVRRLFSKCGFRRCDRAMCAKIVLLLGGILAGVGMAVCRVLIAEGPVLEAYLFGARCAALALASALAAGCTALWLGHHGGGQCGCVPIGV